MKFFSLNVMIFITSSEGSFLFVRSTNLDKKFCIFVKIQEDNWNMSKIVIIKWLTNNVFYGRLITQLVEYSADNWEVSSSSLLKPTP